MPRHNNDEASTFVTLGEALRPLLIRIAREKGFRLPPHWQDEAAPAPAPVGDGARG
jgi:hypothetical protein